MAAFFVNRLVHMKSYSTWTTWRYGKQRSNKTKRKWYSDTALCATLLKWAKNECGIRFFQNGENQRSKKNVTKLAALAKYKGLKRWFHTQQKKNFIEGYGSKIFLLYKQTVEHWINKRKVSILRVDVQAKKIVAEIDATNGTTQSLHFWASIAWLVHFWASIAWLVAGFIKRKKQHQILSTQKWETKVN